MIDERRLRSILSDFDNDQIGIGECENLIIENMNNVVNPVLAEVRADLQRLLFFAMDRNDGWDDELSEKIKEIINKVS